MTENKNTHNLPDTTIDAKKAFDIDVDLKVPAYTEPDEYVPIIDKNYYFDKDTTLSILAGFKHNRRVLIQGYHGTGKSTHIEQIAARLNWRCVRVNLDSHISRIDLIGRDAIVLQEEKQVTTFKEGILPWAIQSPTALVFDEYDAGRPDVMFVIQRILESDGKLTLLDQSKVITPHKSFRLFATTNTVGLGDTSGIYHGTQQINHGQMDRWNIVSSLNYLDEKIEVKVTQFNGNGHATSWKGGKGIRGGEYILVAHDVEFENIFVMMSTLEKADWKSAGNRGGTIMPLNLWWENHQDKGDYVFWKGKIKNVKTNSNPKGIVTMDLVDVNE